MDDPMEVSPGVRVPLSEIELRASRSSGPGGQHANVTASRVEASLELGASQAFTEDQRRRLTSRLGPVARAVAQDTRSQTRNRELALERLRSRLAGALAVPRARRATRPTAGARRRRAESKRRHSERKRQRRRPDTSD